MDFLKLKVETERLIIRPYKNEDYLNWYTQYDKRTPSQYKYDDGRPEDMSVSTEIWFHDWIKTFNESAKQDQMYVLGIFRKSDGANVGKVECIKILRMDYQWAMMGYSIHNQFWKKGYATEAVSAATQLFFAELDFHRLELHINVDNDPSIRLAERTGFQFECERKQFSLENELWTDMAIYYKNSPI